jgi:hypothetical protein
VLRWLALRGSPGKRSLPAIASSAFEKLVVGVVTVTFGERATVAGYRLESRLLWRGSKIDAADAVGESSIWPAAR